MVAAKGMPHKKAHRRDSGRLIGRKSTRERAAHHWVKTKNGSAFI